jgi:NDP-sugar pyrophosphorylase family protein
MLLAAGLGTRLGAVTDETPKCMLPVGGRPILERTVEWLARNGIVQLAVNLHHRPEAVTSKLGDGSDFGVSIRYSHEPELLGTAGALRPLAEWLGEGRFLVLYGDNLIECDLARLAALHERERATMTIALFHRDDVSASGAATVDEAGRIHGFREKPPSGEEPSQWVNAGLLLCEPGVLDHIPVCGPADFGRDVIPALVASGERVFGYRMGSGESLHWVDTPAELASVDTLFRRQELAL